MKCEKISWKLLRFDSVMQDGDDPTLGISSLRVSCRVFAIEYRVMQVGFGFLLLLKCWRLRQFERVMQVNSVLTSK